MEGPLPATALVPERDDPVAGTWFTGAPLKCRDGVLGKVEKSGFYCFARQSGLQRVNAFKTGRGRGEFYSVQGVGRDQLMDNSWIG